MTIRRPSLVFFFSLLFVRPALVAAQQTRPADERPRLVVLVVVDQMRGDYLPRYGPCFAEGGFARLMSEGADFRNAHWSYGSTATAPGHASISTGRLPRQHGITGNEWYLAAGSTHAQLPIDDTSCKIVGVEDARPLGFSSRNLVGPGFGDALRLADRRSRIFSVGLKDRATILLGGKKPDAALWWDLETGNFVSSTHYMKALPPYAEAFNREHWADRFIGKAWDKLLAESAYADCWPLDPRWIEGNADIGSAFPHALPAVADRPDRGFYGAVMVTPFGNEVVLEMVRRVLAGEKLGQGEATDLLCIALSANDAVGHVFGPESAEMKDMTVRTDRQIAGLLGLLDAQVGRGRYLLGLTADHGVKSVPELAQSLGLGGSRLDGAKVIHDLEVSLVRQFGRPRSGPQYVNGIEWPWLYLDRGVEELEPPDLARVIDAAAQHLRHVPGVEEVFTAPELAGPPPLPEEREKLMAWRCYFPGRAGQFYLQLSPYWHVLGDKTTGHCTSHSHDRHVPILLYGPGVRPGTYFTPADGLDVVVTLSALLGVEPPVDAIGRVLHEAIR